MFQQLFASEKHQLDICYHSIPCSRIEVARHNAMIHYPVCLICQRSVDGKADCAVQY